MANKLYDLTVSQKLNLLEQQYTWKQQITNIPATFLLERDISFDLLRKAAELAVSRNDCFRIRLTKDGREIRQFFTDGEHPQFEIWDFKNKSEKEMTDAIRKSASKRITLMDRLLYRIFLLRDFHGWCGLYFLVSHLIIDSYALCVFFNDFAHCLGHLEGKEPMPKPLFPYEGQLVKELELAKSEAHARDLAWWEQELREHPRIFTHPAGPERLEKMRRWKKDPNFPAVFRFQCNNLTSSGFRTILNVPKDLVDGINHYCKKSGSITPVVFYEMAFYGYFARACHMSSASLTNILSMRAKLSQHMTGGCMVHTNTFCLSFDWDDTFANQALAAQKRQFAFMRHSIPSADEIKKLVCKVNKTSPLMFENGALFSFQTAAAELAQDEIYHTMWYPNGAYGVGFYVSVMDDDGSGAWRVYYDIAKGQFTREQCITMHNRLLAFFRLALADDSRTLESLWNEAMKIQ